MTKNKSVDKQDINMGFAEALTRFAKTAPKELDSALEDYELARKLAKVELLSDDTLIEEVEERLKGGTRRGKKRFRL